MTPAPGRISKLRSNPATRAALDAKFLTPQQRQQRALNQRLDAPVTPGSSMTGRQLAHSRDAALQVQFGPAENAINQQLAGQGQLGSDLDKAYVLYLKDLQDHAANIRNLNTASNTADQQLTASVGGLKSDVTGAQQDVQDKAGQATAIRQALLASFGAEHNAVGTSNASYADTLANVVGPGQKLQNTAQQGRNTLAIRQKLIDLAGQKGAAGKAYMADTIAGEAKNALANQALGLNVAKADVTAASGRASRREQRRHNKAQEQATANDPTKQKTQAELDFFKKHGYWPPTGPPKTPKAATGSGPDWLTQSEMGAGLSQATKLKGLAQAAKDGQPFIAGHKPQPPMSRPEAAQKINDSTSGLKDPVLLTAALDAAYDGHLSPSTVRALIASGYKPSRVASALGVPTSGMLKNTGKNTAKAPTGETTTAGLPLGPLAPQTPA